MSKAVIVPLGLFVQTRQIKTIQAFKRLGISLEAIGWQFSLHALPPRFVNRFPSWLGPYPKDSLLTTIENYRKGAFNTAEFRKQIRAIFPGASFSNEEFDAAWNDSCEINVKVMQDLFNEIRALERNNITVFVTANTNELHLDGIKKALREIPGNGFFSHEKKAFGQSLDTEVLKSARALSASPIAMLYRPAGQYPSIREETWRWPFKAYFHYKATQRVQQVTSFAKGNGISLVACQATKQSSHLLSALRQHGWDLGVEHKEGKTFTPAQQRVREQAQPEGRLPTLTDAVNTFTNGVSAVRRRIGV